MPHTLQIGIKTPFGLDVGVTDQVAHLGLFAAEITFLAHIILHICAENYLPIIRLAQRAEKDRPFGHFRMNEKHSSFQTQIQVFSFLAIGSPRIAPILKRKLDKS